MLFSAVEVRETTLVSAELTMDTLIVPPLELDTAMLDGWSTLIGIVHH
jgi:hypothetical protein